MGDYQTSYSPQEIGSSAHAGHAAGVDAMFYVVRTGCQWDNLPHEYPNHNSGYYHYHKWCEEGTWEAMNRTLGEHGRVEAGRQPQPSAAVIDSQSVKTPEVGGERGMDGGKLVKGRKRHIVVDTMGNLLKVIGLAANGSDPKGAMQLLEDLAASLWKRLERIWADGGYRGG